MTRGPFRAQNNFSALVAIASFGFAAGLMREPSAIAQAPGPASAPPNASAPPASSSPAAAPAASPTPANAPGFLLTPLMTEAELGDPIEVVLSVPTGDFDPASITRVEFKLEDDRWAAGSEWTPLKRLPAKWGEKKAGKALWSARVHGFEPGKQKLPEATVHYRGAGAVDESTAIPESPEVEIKGVRAATETTKDLRGLKGLAEPPVHWTPWIVGALALAAAAALARWAWLRRMNRPVAEAPPEPILPPVEWALLEIARRRALPVVTAGPPKEVFTLCSEVIRVYLGRRYGFDAMEMTTVELERALKGRRVASDIRRRVKNLLGESDLVKFTTFEPPRDRWKTIWADARELVEASAPAHGEIIPEPGSEIAASANGAGDTSSAGASGAIGAAAMAPEPGGGEAGGAS